MLEKDEITFEEFVDLEGQIYKIHEITELKEMSEEKTSVLTGCSHNYVNGYYKRHTTKSDGGCVVTTYNAQICTICGTVIVGSLYSTATYPKCPH